VTTVSRQTILDEAQSWLGTPFHDCASEKGVGVDCAMLLKKVFENSGAVELFDAGIYSPQWFLHRDQELFMDTVRRYAREVSEDEVLPGDIVLYKIGRCYAHGAIVESWPHSIIHAHKASGRVIRTTADDSDMRGRLRKFFTLW